MATEVTYLGGAGVGAFMPTSLAALAAAEAAITIPIIDIQGKIAGAAAASASIAIQPPSLDLVAAIEGALQLPGIAVDVSAMASLAASLNVDLGTLSAALALVLAVKAGLGTAGVHAYAVNGEVGGMAGALGTALASGLPGEGPTDVGVGIFIVAGADPAAVAAIRLLFDL